MTIRLRDYQESLVAAIRHAYFDGRRSPLVVLPTGGGKTTIFAYITDSAASRGRCVYLLAHRAELVKQIAGTLGRFGRPHRVVAPGPIVRQVQVAHFRERGRSLVDQTAPVVVASVQTLVRRLHEPALPTPDLIVIDEAHHLTADSTWGRIVERWPDARLLPVTATPCRLDGKGLGIGAGGFADDLVMGPSMQQLIDDGHLCRYRVYAPPTAIDVSGVKTRAGDFARDQLAAAVDQPQITGDVVEHYRRLAAGRRAVAFCVSVAHARHVARQFCDAGIAAEFLDGTTDATERDAIIKRFEAGQTLVLSSCDIVSEGFDVPAIEAAILLRPTKSLALYLQQVGRALRPSDGKVDAVIIDHVGNVIRHGLPSEDREWTLDGVKPRARSASEDDDEDAVASVRTCPQCFTISLPVPVCPACGFVHPVRERQVKHVDGDLAEISVAEASRLRMQARLARGRARTVEQLVATGISRPRAIKIVEARRQKEALIDRVTLLLGNVRASTGEGPHAACGHTLQEIPRLKPRELREIAERLEARVGQIEMRVA